MSQPHLPHRRLVAALFGTLKLMQMYGRDHDATADALTNLADAVHNAMQDQQVSVSVRGNRLQVNGRAMRSAECGNLALSFLAEEWVRRGIETVRFHEEVRAGDLANFASAFMDLDVSRPEAAERLMVACAELGCEHIVIERREQEEIDPILLEERRESAMRSYLRGLRAFKEVLRCESLQDKTKVRRARRAVQGLVDGFLEDEAAVIKLAQIRGHDVKLFHHSLNVCIYTLVIGQGLGMTRRQLGEAGLAALFHDIGKTFPVDEDGRAAEPQWASLRQHPARGARMLLEEGTAHEGMLKAAIAAYEHHTHYDGTGYPSIDHAPHSVSRMVAIADCYEALTSARAYRDTPYTPCDALALMQSKAGTLFDPVLLKVFVNGLGVYPVGTLVELSTGEVGIVAEGPSDTASIARPKVRILAQEKGVLVPETVVDLMETDAAGEHVRSVARTLAPHEVFSDVSEYVAASL